MAAPTATSRAARRASTMVILCRRGSAHAQRWRLSATMRNTPASVAAACRVEYLLDGVRRPAFPIASRRAASVADGTDPRPLSSLRAHEMRDPRPADARRSPRGMPRRVCRTTSAGSLKPDFPCAWRRWRSDRPRRRTTAGPRLPFDRPRPHLDVHALDAGPPAEPMMRRRNRCVAASRNTGSSVSR
jgi:hypothetical protein